MISDIRLERERIATENAQLTLPGVSASAPRRSCPAEIAKRMAKSSLSAAGILCKF